MGETGVKNYFVTTIQGIFTNTFKKPWPLGAGLAAMAVANLYMFTYARALGVFPQIANWGSSFYNLLGIATEGPFYPVTPFHLDVHTMLNLGIILGAAATALAAREFKFRKENPLGYLMGLLGGILMGFGTVLIPPCNVGGFWVATMAFSLSGMLAAVGLLLGAYVGGKILRWPMERALQQIDFSRAVASGSAMRDKKPPSAQPVYGAIVFLIIIALALLYKFFNRPAFSVLLIFGTAFGMIIQRSRICFAAAFREILISKDGTVMKMVLLSIAFSAIGFAILKGQGHMPMHMVWPAGWHTMAGGFIFGIGMVIAGGCGVGILVRGGEGYLRSWVAILGGMLAAGAWVNIYGHKVGEGWLYGKPVFLPQYAGLGWGGAFAVVFAFLAVFYLFILWVESKKISIFLPSEVILNKSKGEAK
jgi:uncharacterized membrane protein YedE/YeeE